MKDQFEWPLFEQDVTPERFSIILAADLGISGEFIPMIAHSIREQVVLARLEFHESIAAPDYSTCLRDDEEMEWEPDLQLLDDEQINMLAKEEDRNNRRLRRQRQSFPVPSTVKKNYVPPNGAPVVPETPAPKPVTIVSNQSSPVPDYFHSPEILEKQLELLERNIATPIHTPAARSMTFYEQEKGSFLFM